MFFVYFLQLTYQRPLMNEGLPQEAPTTTYIQSLAVRIHLRPATFLESSVYHVRTLLLPNHRLHSSTFRLKWLSVPIEILPTQFQFSVLNGYYSSLE